MSEAEPERIPDPPKQVSTAVIVVIAAAAVNVVAGILSLLQVDRVRLAVSGSAADRGIDAASLQSIVAGVFTGVVVASVLYSVALVLLVLGLRGGRTWTRPVLVGASFLAVLGFLVSNEAALAVLVLLAIGDVMLYQRPVSDWVRRMRPPRPTS